MTSLLTSLLYQEVTPLSQRKPLAREGDQVGPPPAEARAVRTCEDANAAKRLKALLAYHACWEPDEIWLHTSKVDSRRGVSRTGSLPQLRAWEKLGWVSPRAVNPKKPQAFGYEWRWHLDRMPADLREKLLAAASLREEGE